MSRKLKIAEGHLYLYGKVVWSRILSVHQPCGGAAIWSSIDPALKNSKCRQNKIPLFLDFCFFFFNVVACISFSFDIFVGPLIVLHKFIVRSYYHNKSVVHHLSEIIPVAAFVFDGDGTYRLYRLVYAKQLGQPVYYNWDLRTSGPEDSEQPLPESCPKSFILVASPLLCFTYLSPSPTSISISTNVSLTSLHPPRICEQTSTKDALERTAKDCVGTPNDKKHTLMAILMTPS